MNCIVPGINIKVLARSVQALAKVGDVLYIEAHPDKLSIITFIQCKTVLAKSNFLESFFSHYEVQQTQNGGENTPVLCRIHVKTLLAVFKGAQFEKKLDYIKLEYVNDSNVINFKVKYKQDDILLNHTLRLLDPEVFQMQDQVNRSGSHICATSSFYNQLLAMFGTTDDDITLEITKNKIVARNYCIGTISQVRLNLDVKNPIVDLLTGSPVRPKSVRTQVNLNASEFLVFQVQTETTINFSLKPLKTLIHFSEAFVNIQVGMNFEQGGRPLLLTVKNPTFEFEIIVSTINPYNDANSTLTTASLATKITQVSTNGLHNLTSDDIAALAELANDNWDGEMSDDESKEDRNKTNKKLKKDDGNKNSKEKKDYEKDEEEKKSKKKTDNNGDLDVIPASPESPRTKRLKLVFKRSFEPTFHPSMLGSPTDGEPFVPDTDDEMDTD